MATKQADSRELIEGPENSGDFAATVKKVAKDLRDSREYDLLDQFVEELRERGVTDPQLFKLQAQSLIERGKPATALVRLEAIANSDQFVEAHGARAAVSGRERNRRLDDQSWGLD